MAAGTHRDHKRGGRFGQQGCSKGRGHPYQRPQTASANVAQQNSFITCYKCGETGHIAPQCPDNGCTSSVSGSTNSSTGTSAQRRCTAPPARGHAATAQEGESSGTSTANTNRDGTHSSLYRNAMVCMARTVPYEHVTSTRWVVDYNTTPDLSRPAPQPIPVLDVDHEGEHFLDTDRFITLVFPISPGSFNPTLENHIAHRVIPAHYNGTLNPLHDGIWMLLHSVPLSEVDRSFVVITYPNNVADIVIETGVIPMLETQFGIPTETLHNCTARFCFLVHAYLVHRFSHFW
jgi:hypothetical protein